LETAHTTILAVKTAFANRKAREGLVFHSDRGRVASREASRDRLVELRPSVRQSVSRKGNY
jgi:hypothetical protein